jgi:uncharacterized membrane protein HdeD (DUF308 family)
MAIGQTELRAEARAVGRQWWVFLVTGIAWLVYSWIVLSLGDTTVWAIAILAGLGFIAVGVNEFMIAGLIDSWKWLHLVGGVLCIGAGIIAFAWPSETYLVLAGILAWFLLFRGTFDVVTAFMVRDEYDLWWLTLIAGLAQIVIGFWAVGYTGRSLLLLAYWVGFFALFRGITEILLAFRLRRAAHEPG